MDSVKSISNIKGLIYFSFFNFWRKLQQNAFVTDFQYKKQKDSAWGMEAKLLLPVQIVFIPT